MNKFLKFSKNLLIRNKKAFFQSMLFVFVLTALQAFLPVSMRWIIAEVEIRQSYPFLAICIVNYALFLLIYNFIDIGWIKSLDRLGGKMLEGIREDLYKAISQANYEELMLIGKDKLKNILYMDTLDIFRSVAFQTIQAIANILLIIVFLGISAYINLKLTLALLIASVIGFLISMFSRKPITNASMQVNKKMKEDNKTLNEYVDALELTKTNDLDEYFLKKGKESLWNFINTSIKADNILIFLKNIVSEFHQVVSIGIAAILSMTMGGSSVGDLVFYLFIADIVLDTSQKIESSIYILIKLFPAFENVDKILHLNKCGGKETIKNIETIEFKDVDFHYENNQKIIINKKNIILKKGDIVRVNGVNGGGKSTFVKLIAGLLYPKNGQILLNGIAINDIFPTCLKNQILYIDQDEIILNDKIKNYLEAISGQKISEEKLKELENIVKFDNSISQVTENGHSLSGGQRKKLLMIKLILKYKLASVIILDEIEAGLDIETKNTVLELEQEIINSSKDCIFFKIAHETKQDNIYTKTISI